MLPRGVKHHASDAVGDVGTQLHAGFGDAENLRIETTRVERLEYGLEARRIQCAIANVLLNQAGHELRGFHQGLFGRLTVTRVQIGHHAVKHEADASYVDQQDANEDAGALAQTDSGKSSLNA